jgi:hypothetical protein
MTDNKQLNISTIKNIINEQNKEKNIIIQTAIDSSYRMLNIEEFAKHSNMNVNDLFLNKLWYCFRADVPVYLSDELTLMFGYGGAIGTQRGALLKLMKRQEIPFIELTNNDYEKFLSRQMYKENLEDKSNDDELISKIYPEFKFSNGKAKLKHILVLPENLKKLMMIVNTKSGDIVRSYYIALERLFEMYVKYQLEYQNKQIAIRDRQNDELTLNMQIVIEQNNNSAKRIEDLISLNEDMKEELQCTNENFEVHEEMLSNISEKLDIATNDRAPKTNSMNKHGQFIVLKLNDLNVKWDYYVIRAQNVASVVRLNKIREASPASEILVNIKYSPNAVNLYNLIKQELKEKKKDNHGKR